MAKKKAASAKVKITKTGLAADLTGVEASERRRKKKIPEGIYVAEVVKVEGRKFSTGSQGVVFQLKVTGGNPKGKGAMFWENIVLIDSDGEVMENTLWRLRGMLQALSPSIKIPDSLLKVPFDKLKGRTCAIEVGDGEDDKGNIVSEVLDTFHEKHMEEEDDDEVEDDEEEEDEEEEWDEDEDDDEEEDEEDEAEEEDEDEEEEEEEWDLEEDEL